MSLLDILFKKNKKDIKTNNKHADEPFDKERMDQIVAYLKENCSETCVFITAEKSDTLSIFDSKFGGLPYWDPALEYPKDRDEKMLVLLAQINFDNAGINNELLPKKGILQFYIAPGDQYGADFSNNTVQNGFRVVYHEEVNYDVTEEMVLSLGIVPNTDRSMDGEYLPLDKQYSLNFDEDKDSVNGSMEQYEECIKNALKELFGENVEGDVSKAFSRKEYDYIFNKSGWGHKMLGYPSFTQWDPRKEGEHDTLLLQIDSKDDILWGDMGIANFFIDKEKLKDLDFSDVVYNWDCY